MTRRAGMAGAVDESWAAVREGIIAGAGASPAPTMVAATLPELLDDAAAWRFAQAGVPAAAGLRTGIACAAAMRLPAGDSARLREIAAVAGRVVADPRTRPSGSASTSQSSCCARAASRSSMGGSWPIPPTR